MQSCSRIDWREGNATISWRTPPLKAVHYFTGWDGTTPGEDAFAVTGGCSRCDLDRCGSSHKYLLQFWSEASLKPARPFSHEVSSFAALLRLTGGDRGGEGFTLPDTLAAFSKNLALEATTDGGVSSMLLGGSILSGGGTLSRLGGSGGLMGGRCRPDELLSWWGRCTLTLL